MLKIKTSHNKIIQSWQGIVTVLVAGVLAGGVMLSPLVRADSYDEQINALKQQNATAQVQQDQLGAQAASLSDQIAKLQAQISALQAQINDNQAKRDATLARIAEAEAELAKQKLLLGENIRAMYLEGDISTLEQLASSKDLSEFVDKEQYRTSVENKISETVDKINALKKQLDNEKITLEKLIADQQAIQSQLNAQQAEVSRLLNLNQAQQAELDSQIKANNSKISGLRAAQAAENAKRFSRYTVVAGNNGNDTYPNVWRNSAQDSMIDSWGMYNRECVSYTAWKVASSGRYMPNWGGVGNANQWDDNARRMGIPVDGNPRPGDVAIAHWGYYGHAMYVESVNGDGTINISQYNYDYNGTYSEIYHFSASGLVFIHF